jgi:uncharacterized protein
MSPHWFPWSAVLILVGALLLGAILNGRALLDTASSLQPGWQRDVAMAAAQLLVDTGEALHLDVPRELIDRGLGRVPTTTFPAAIPEPTTTTTTIVTTTSTPVATTAPQETTTTTTITTTTTTTTILPGVFAPTPESPAHLWVAGDSLTERFGPSLVNLLAETGVLESRRNVEYSTGLTRPDFFDWPRRLEHELTENPTDILVFMVGANDGQPIQTSAGWIPFGTDEWVDEYRLRVASTMDLVSDLVPTTYWIGQPIARSDEYSAKMALMNGIYESEGARRPNVRYVDSWALFSDIDGNYSAYLPDATGTDLLMRSSDGIHLTVDGGDRLADQVRKVISADWPLPDASQG